MEGSQTQKSEPDLNASALETRPAEDPASPADDLDPPVDERNEEEDVAYDEEPEEVEAEAAGPSVDERSEQDEQIEQVPLALLLLTARFRCSIFLTRSRSATGVSSCVIPKPGKPAKRCSSRYC